VHSLALGR